MIATAVKWPRWLMFCALLAAAGTWARAAVPEADLKAVLLFHLTQFVQWPAGDQGSTFAIGVLGPDEFGPALDQAVKGELIAGQPIRIRRGNVAADLAGCRLVYVCPGARQSPAEILAALSATPTLLVGESTRFLEEGGMISFLMSPSRKIQLEIQLDHLRAAGLTVSAQLLRVAVVQGGAR